MPFTFDIEYVDTGSLAIGFKVEAPEVAPESIVVRYTDPELVVVTSDPVEVFKTGKPDYFIANLVGPLPYEVAYTVEVLIDDEVQETKEVIIPSPKYRRSPVLRQRLYEVLLEAYDNGDITAIPFGSRHAPSSVNVSFNKGTEGTFIEVCPAYINSMNYYQAVSNTIEEVVVPLRAYAAMDSKDDTEILAEDFEEVAGYLLSNTWNLNSFGLIQNSSRIECQQPQIDQNRRATMIQAELIVDMRKKIS